MKKKPLIFEYEETEHLQRKKYKDHVRGFGCMSRSRVHSYFCTRPKKHKVLHEAGCGQGLCCARWK